MNKTYNCHKETKLDWTDITLLILTVRTCSLLATCFSGGRPHQKQPQLHTVVAKANCPFSKSSANETDVRIIFVHIEILLYIELTVIKA
jgi:hypothetical protein